MYSPSAEDLATVACFLQDGVTVEPGAETHNQMWLHSLDRGRDILALISGGANRHRWDLLLIGGGQHMIDKNLKVQDISTMNCSNFCPD